MPWKESTRMDERLAFVEAYLSGLYEMAELCRCAGVSRPTGYLWLERFRQQGEAGLLDRSHAVHHCPHRTASHTGERLLQLRREQRRITHGGSLCWRSSRFFLSSVLAHETVGLEEIEDGVWSIYFARHLLARLDEHLARIIEVPV